MVVGSDAELLSVVTSLGRATRAVLVSDSVAFLATFTVKVISG